MRGKLFLAALTLLACDDSGGGDGGSVDAAQVVDARSHDAAPDGAAPDGRVVDAATAADAATPDVDSADFGAPDGPDTDAGTVDAGAADGAVDVGDSPDGAPADGAASDGPLADGPLPDAQAPDAAAPDAQAPDAAAPDAQAPDAEAPDAAAGGACDHPRSACTQDADCPGGACQPFPVDGSPCLCVGPAPDPQLNPCFNGPGEGECCADGDCGDGRVCQAAFYGAQNDYCGGAAPPDFNQCAGDGCSTHADCGAGRVCVPGGVFGHVYAACRPAGCLVDADCDVRAGGECLPFFERCHVAGFGCYYEGDPCRTSRDCPPGMGFGIPLCTPLADRAGTQCEEAFLPP